MALRFHTKGRARLCVCVLAKHEMCFEPPARTHALLMGFRSHSSFSDDCIFFVSNDRHEGMGWLAVNSLFARRGGLVSGS